MFDSLRELKDNFKPWKFGLFVGELRRVSLGGAEVPTTTLVRALICEPFSAVLGHLRREKAAGWDGMRFC